MFSCSLWRIPFTERFPDRRLSRVGLKGSVVIGFEHFEARNRDTSHVRFIGIAANVILVISFGSIEGIERFYFRHDWIPELRPKARNALLGNLLFFGILVEQN